jgi:hypothetical protein
VEDDRQQQARRGDLFERQEQQSPEDLTTFLQDFLNNTFGSEDDFSLEEPKPQADGSVLIVWSYKDRTRSGLEVLGNSFIEQRENKVSLISMIVPSEQFDALNPDTNKIINSYKIDPSAALP